MEYSPPLVEHLRLKESILNRPSKTEPVSGVAVIYSKMGTQIFKAGGDSPHCKDHVSSSVSSLLKSSCPLAIFLRIANGIVDSFNRKFARLFTHVFQEIVKRMSPSVTHGYSASAVAMVFCGFCAVTSFNNVSPASVGRGHIPNFGVPMFYSKTPAGTSVSTFDIVVSGNHSFTAIAFADTASFLSFSNPPSFGNYSKSLEFLTNQIKFCRHGVVPFNNAVFSSGRPAVTGARYDIALNERGSQQSSHFVYGRN